MPVTIPLTTLRNRIAEAIAGNVKAYDVPALCFRVSIQSSIGDDDGAEAYNSRRSYVKKRLLTRSKAELLIIADKLLQEFDAPELADTVSEMTVHSEHRVTEITRRDVLKALNPLDTLFGDVDVFDGLNIIASSPLQHDGLDDHLNFLPSVAKEIDQHYVRNDDFTHEDVLIRCDALTCSQTKFFTLIEKLLHPVVRRGEEQTQLAAVMDDILKQDGFAVVVTGAQSSFPIYGVKRRLSGVLGSMKNLIFASVGNKPELIFRDAINNDVEIVSNADKVLIYDRPLPPSGMLRWKDLETWWQQTRMLDDAADAKAQLYRHLLDAVRKTKSPGELGIFYTYYKCFGPRLGEKLPALIPQVYLHYDPYTKRQRGDEQYLARQRMDFLLMLNDGVRIVIEVDGRLHYAVTDSVNSKVFIAKPSLYASMVAEDRRLRLAGYEVYRFGGAEFHDVDLNQPAADAAVGPASQALVMVFFENLLAKYKLL